MRGLNFLLLEAASGFSIFSNNSTKVIIRISEKFVRNQNHRTNLNFSSNVGSVLRSSDSSSWSPSKCVHLFLIDGKVSSFRFQVGAILSLDGCKHRQNRKRAHLYFLDALRWAPYQSISELMEHGRTGRRNDNNRQWRHRVVDQGDPKGPRAGRIVILILVETNLR